MKKLTTILLLAAAQIFAAGAIAAGTISTKIISPKGATNLAVFEGDPITLEADAERMPYSSTIASYSWWYASTDGKKWIYFFDVKDLNAEETTISNSTGMIPDGHYKGEHAVYSKLEISGLKETMKFKFELMGKDNKKATTGVYTVSVYPRTTVDVGLTTRYVFDGSDKKYKDADCKLKFTARASGKAPFKYQWYEVVGGKKTPIKNAKAASYTTPRITDFNKQYMVEVSNAAGTVESKPITIKRAVAAKIATQPANAFSGDKNSSGTFSIVLSADSGENPKFQWQRCDVGKSTAVESNWKSAGAASTSGVCSTLVVKNPTAKLNGARYRCIVSNAASEKPIVSNAAKLTVYPSAKITAQPKAATVIAGNEFELNCAATGVNVIYIWEKSDDNGKTWAVLQSGKSGSLKITLDEAQKAKFRCKAVSRTERGNYIYPEAASSAVLITANEPAKIDEILITQLGDETETVFIDYPFELKAVASGKAIKYQWYESSDGGASFAEIRGARAATYKVAKGKYKREASMLFKCEVSNKFGTQTSEASKTVAAELMNSPVPVSLEGYGFVGYIDGAFTNAIFTDKSNMRMAQKVGKVKKEVRYTCKRTSPVSADISITLTPFDDYKGKFGKAQTLKYELSYADGTYMLCESTMPFDYADRITLYKPDVPAFKANELKDGMTFKSKTTLYSTMTFKITDAKKRQFTCFNSDGIEFGSGTYTYAVKSPSTAIITFKLPKPPSIYDLKTLEFEYAIAFETQSSASVKGAAICNEYVVSKKNVSRYYACSTTFEMKTAEQAAGNSVEIVKAPNIDFNDNPNIGFEGGDPNLDLGDFDIGEDGEIIGIGDNTWGIGELAPVGADAE